MDTRMALPNLQSSASSAGNFDWSLDGKVINADIEEYGSVQRRHGRRRSDATKPPSKRNANSRPNCTWLATNRYSIFSKIRPTLTLWMNLRNVRFRKRKKLPSPILYLS